MTWTPGDPTGIRIRFPPPYPIWPGYYGPPPQKRPIRLSLPSRDPKKLSTVEDKTPDVDHD